MDTCAVSTGTASTGAARESRHSGGDSWRWTGAANDRRAIRHLVGRPTKVSNRILATPRHLL